MDAHFSSFGPGARWVEWGISTHKGEEYGELNRLLMLLGCLSVVLLAVSGVLMWWKRRPSGRLGAPARILGARTARLVAPGMVRAGMVFPLTGLSVLAAFLVEKLYVHFARVAPAQVNQTLEASVRSSAPVAPTRLPERKAIGAVRRHD